MSKMDTVARSLHDLGLASWFGGSLMGAVGLNGAAAEMAEPAQRARVANEGWARWTPVNGAAIGTHLLGALQLTRANRARMAAQSGVRGASYLKAAMTAAALGATVYSRLLGQRAINAGDAPAAGATEPGAQTPPDVADAQRQLRVMQWTIPALTGAVLVLSSLLGEQQRPRSVLRGVVGRVVPAFAR